MLFIKHSQAVEVSSHPAQPYLTSHMAAFLIRTAGLAAAMAGSVISKVHSVGIAVVGYQESF